MSRRIHVGIKTDDLSIRADENALAFVQANDGHGFNAVSLGKRAVVVDQEIKGQFVLGAKGLVAF